MAGRPVQPAVCGAEDGLPSELSHSPSLSRTLTGRWVALPRASADGGPGWGVQVASWPRSHGGRGAGPWQRVLDDEGRLCTWTFLWGLWVEAIASQVRVSGKSKRGGGRRAL